VLSIEFFDLKSALCGSKKLKNCVLNDSFSKDSSATPLIWYSFVYVNDVKIFKKVIEWKYSKVLKIWNCYKKMRIFIDIEDKDDDIPCPHCTSRNLVNKGGLGSHLRSHYKCTFCSPCVAFKQIDFFVRHLVENHCYLQCRTCDQFAQQLNYGDDDDVKAIFSEVNLFIKHVKHRHIDNKRKADK
jgi:DNA-directed RNA polymerase subunit RPC12/RpoP